MSAEANYVRVDIHQLLSDTHQQPRQPISSSEHSALVGGSGSDHQHPSMDAAANPSISTMSSDKESPQPSTSAQLPPIEQRQLLCTVRALLRKMSQRVLVGDRVRVGRIDWAAGRGQVEEILERSNRLLDPAVANVDHVLLLFGLTQPPVGARDAAESC